MTSMLALPRAARPPARPRRVAVVAALGAVLSVPLASPGASAQQQPSRDYTMTGKIALPFRPGDVAVDPGTATLYVTDPVGDTVAVVDERTGAIRRRIDVGPVPGAVTVDPTTGDVFATSTGHGTLTVIDRTGAVRSTVAIGTKPAALVQDPATRTVYVADLYHPGVAILDQDTGKVSRIDLDLYPTDLAVDPARGAVYVSQQHPGGLAAANVLVIDTRSGRVTRKIVVPRKATGLAVDPDTHELWATDYLGCAVSIIDVDTGTVRAETGVGDRPTQVAIDPSIDTAFVLDNWGQVFGDDTRVGITVIDTRTGNVIDTVPVVTPGTLAVDPASGAVLVSSSGSTYSRLAVLAAPPTANAPWPRSLRGSLPLPGGGNRQFRVGVDRDVWALQVSQQTVNTNTYSGQIKIDQGAFSDVRPVGLERGDTWTVDGGTITFSVTNRGGKEGLSFTTPTAASEIIFQLAVDGSPATAWQISTGGLGQNAPSGSPVSFRRAPN